MSENDSSNNLKVPIKVFIVPYRNRPEQKLFFTKYMGMILEHATDYEIYFSHQADERSFNRGACKNIGFLAVKEKYPNHYQDINFVFHDLDTVPFHRIFDYTTQPGVVTHHYGFEHSLGGIVIIRGADFEKINGFPNYWSWGLEDSCLQKRCEAANIPINRSHFYKIGSPEILHLFDGVSRLINKKDPKRFNADNGKIGLSTLKFINYEISDRSCNEKDNLYQATCDHIFFINTKVFQSETNSDSDQYFNYDLREPPKNIMHPDPKKKTTEMVPKTDSWSDIPHMLTALEKREIAKQQQQQMARPIKNVPANAFHRPVQSFSPHPPPPPQRPAFVAKPHAMQRKPSQPPLQQQITPQQYRQIYTKNANVALAGIGTRRR